MIPNDEFDGMQIIFCMALDDLAAIAKKQNRPIYEVLDDITLGVKKEKAKRHSDKLAKKYIPRAANG